MIDKMYNAIPYALIIVLVMIVVAFAVERPQVPILEVRPLYNHLIEAPQDWKKAYGDTLEARFIYNLAVMRSNQLEIAKMISRLHPPVEPNVPIDPNR